MEPDTSSAPKLPLFSMATVQSPEHSGMLTPPLYTSASVPFRWEEEPGKPRPCTALITLPTSTTTESPRCLDLPPRLFLEPSKITKTPSPTTVLEGPYVLGRPKFTSSSFRFFRERQGSFDSSSSKSPERGQLSSMVLGKKLHKGRGLFGSWRQKTPKFRSGKREAGGSCSFVHPSSVSVDGADTGSDDGNIPRVKIGRIRRNGSFSSLSQAKSQFWAAVYEGFKQVLPWKSRKSKKGVL
ncbi:uncharacterized protein At4g00950-like [Coffea arabica]|uniref:Uncharacterized protein At4g00950-like n=1 Tax=Coffea arabica TaxID=13443 RepID=A0ABM4WLY5_COFAR